MVVKAVAGGYCRLQMPLSPALGVRGTVAGHRLGALEEGVKERDLRGVDRRLPKRLGRLLSVTNASATTI